MKAEQEVVPEYLDFATAGQLVCVSKYTVRHWVQLGRLPASKVGQVVRVKRSDLLALMEGRRTIRERPA
jgi:excisionase family DNA binding protein